MEELDLTFDVDQLAERAQTIFMKSCGFWENSKNQEEYLEEALRVLENCKKSMQPTARISPIAREHFRQHSIQIDEISFQCAAFEQIHPDTIFQIYSYLLTINPCKAKGNTLSEQYYNDVWEDSFLDAAREEIRFHLAKSTSGLDNIFSVTFSFGSELCGVPHEELRDLALLMDGSTMGIQIDGDGIVFPEKTGGGFVFILRDTKKNPSEVFKTYMDHGAGCQFCRGDSQRPTRKSCMNLLQVNKTPPHVIRHCQAVARVAMKIGTALKDRGVPLDLQLLEGASLLHDISRTEENHGVKGAKVALRHGYYEIAQLIRRHMFYISDPDREEISEQDILCLADRMVREDCYVGIEARMQAVINRYKEDPIVSDHIRKRLQENLLLINKIERITKKTIDQLVDEGDCR